MSQPLFHITLVEPEIPANTGNIGRTCVGYSIHLHLIEPLGFQITDKTLKRAGLDYWNHLQWTLHASWEDYWNTVKNPERVFYLSTKGSRSYYEMKTQPGDHFVFGKETKGLNPALLSQWKHQVYKIPMPGPIRSLNLSNTVAMVVGEAYRQVTMN